MTADQEIAEGCKRSIKNAIIGWNYLYLSQKIDQEANPEHRQRLLQPVAQGSILSWQHVNLLGEYDFSEEKLRETVGIRPKKYSPPTQPDPGVYPKCVKYRFMGVTEKPVRVYLPLIFP